MMRHIDVLTHRVEPCGQDGRFVRVVAMSAEHFEEVSWRMTPEQAAWLINDLVPLALPRTMLVPAELIPAEPAAPSVSDLLAIGMARQGMGGPSR